MDLKRGVDPVFLAALKSTFHPVVMVYLDWPDGAVYVHSGVGNISYNGQTWGGVGDFGKIAVPQERAGIVASVASLQLLGVPPEIYGRVNDSIRNRAAQIFIALVTERAGNVLVGTPVEAFSGYMDSMKIAAQDDDGNVVYGVEVGVASGPSARANASITHSNEDQSKAFPTDTAGRFLVHIESEIETWPET